MGRMILNRIHLLPLLGVVLLTWGCKKEEPKTEPAAPAAAAPAPAPASPKIGLVTDVGGRGDQSFNDSALRGLELWARGQALRPAAATAAPPRRS